MYPSSQANLQIDPNLKPLVQLKFPFSMAVISGQNKAENKMIFFNYKTTQTRGARHDILHIAFNLLITTLFTVCMQSNTELKVGPVLFRSGLGLRLTKCRALFELDIRTCLVLSPFKSYQSVI